MEGNARGDIPGTVEILKELKESGQFKLYALTNWSNETFPIALIEYPWLQWFDGIVVSGREKMRKPQAAFYQLLTDRHAVDKSHAIFIDDNLRNVKAAEEFGIESIHFQSPNNCAKRLLAAESFPVLRYSNNSNILPSFHIIETYYASRHHGGFALTFPLVNFNFLL